jgi:hypothetical protein
MKAMPMPTTSRPPAAICRRSNPRGIDARRPHSMSVNFSASPLCAWWTPRRFAVLAGRTLSSCDGENMRPCGTDTFTQRPIRGPPFHLHGVSIWRR